MGSTWIGLDGMAEELRKEFCLLCEQFDSLPGVWVGNNLGGLILVHKSDCMNK